MLLSHVLTDSNNVSHDCVPPAKLDQTGDCTSDTEVEIAAVSSADEEPISDDEEDLIFFLPSDVSKEQREQHTADQREEKGVWQEVEAEDGEGVVLLLQ